MARKRKRRKRSRAPLFLLALALPALVIWAVLPRHRAVPKRAVSQAPQAAVASSPASPPASPAPASPAPATSVPVPVYSPANGELPKLAIIIDDCGQWPVTERALLALPVPLTMSVMPHVRYTAQIAQEARDAGKDVMLHLPMQPLSGKRSGPGEIELKMSDEQITAQTEDDIAQVPLAAGVNNHEGSAASADDRVMRDVLAVVKHHDLFFIDSRTNAKTVAAGDAHDLGIPNASRDVFLDNVAEVKATEAMLRRAVEVAKTKGSAIAIGHPKATTLEALRDMLPQMETRVQFVPAASLVEPGG